jgi:putative ATP-dependent endonuclease of the OLD family
MGHNNAGKTNLIKALQFVLDRNNREKPTIDDFCKYGINYSAPPYIEISINITENNDKPDDKNVVYDWLISDSPLYQARLTYLFELPTKHHKDYADQIQEYRGEDGVYSQTDCLRVIKKNFLSKYVTRIYGGDILKQEKADSANLEKIDFHYLDAIRDAEKQMFYGNNTLLRDVLKYFIDYKLTKGQDIENLDEASRSSIKLQENQFNLKSKELLDLLINRIDRDKILKYSIDTGADNGGAPNFDAEISEEEVLFALRLIVEISGFKIPIANNGLGYNNLLFIALILAKMQMESSSFMGDNAKIFPILAIEEPEAHLHPSMQSKFLKFLNDNMHKSEQARQIFISTHSTHIVAAASLDSIICLYKDVRGNYKVGYPGKVFKETAEDKNSKIFVQRFLDATKSNMLFSERIIFVEGLSEQLLIPCLAECLGKESALIDKHVSIISVDSRTFKHFIKMYDYNAETNPYAINKYIVCITDADPCKKFNNRWKAIFPFDLDDSADSSPLSSHVTELINNYHKVPQSNINIFHPMAGKGKTLEYELAIENPTSEILITDSFPKSNSVHTADNYKKIISQYPCSFTDMVRVYNTLLEQEKSVDDGIVEKISTCSWNEEEKKKAIVASIYYRIVRNVKGEHAFFLEQNIRINNKSGDAKKPFYVPEYIKNAINKILE